MLKNKNLSKQEYCSTCESVSVIDITKFEIQKCSECGIELVPCSLCPHDNCDDCPFDKKE